MTSILDVQVVSRNKDALCALTRCSLPCGGAATEHQVPEFGSVALALSYL